MEFSKDWIDIINKVAKFQKNKAYTWFRGQSKEEYKLNSGLYRITETNDLGYSATENAYYKIFKRMGYTHHNDDSWELLYLMQHHGVKTRLLDWSESFAVALFFAFDNWNEKENNSAIWLLDPVLLNERTLGEEKFYIPDESYEKHFEKEVSFHDNTLALYPVRNSSRMISQQGMFTLQGISNESLEEEFDGDLIENEILKKIILKKNVKKDIEMFLKQNGMSDFSLFPDLDGLAKHINKLGYFRDRLQKEKD